MLLNVGSGGGAAAPPSGGVTGGVPADAPAEEDKKEEKEEGRSSHINIKSMCANSLISFREGGIGRGYGLWAVRLDTTSFCNQHLTYKKIPFLRKRRPGEPLVTITKFALALGGCIINLLVWSWIRRGLL